MTAEGEAHHSWDGDRRLGDIAAHGRRGPCKYYSNKYVTILTTIATTLSHPKDLPGDAGDS